MLGKCSEAHKSDHTGMQSERGLANYCESGFLLCSEGCQWAQGLLVSAHSE